MNLLQKMPCHRAFMIAAHYFLMDLSDLELDSIDDVKNVEFNLRIINTETWDEITTTDVISLNFE